MSDRRSDPAALRFLIGHDLRVSREKAGMKQTEAAKVLGCNQPKINYLETGKTQQKPDEVTALLRAYGADVEHVDRIASLAGQADRTTWWAPFSDVLPDWFRTFVGLEGLAVGQFVYRSRIIPGQMQTENYATAVLEGGLQIALMDVPQVVRSRMARQRLTDDLHPLKIVAVLEEAVLDRLVGGPVVMHEQLQHLLDLMQRENVELHIMPTRVATHDGINDEFMLLDFAEAQSIGYLEFAAGALYVQDQEQVRLYKMMAERMCAAALSALESAEVIAARIANLQA
ncbi:helix-turn-helix domain-containing protein [Nocardia terpenica]|uniref:helix-turn-helix domain-containing protein n=1 Tax=Nocardia terpenica TaxID=455432 RepID=UPI001894C2F7|nr:helix-turn-helix transcriptional regulator [Nocardia terpenica]MBF6064653.1 helix-turn-helix domain-containing protein [Nocardia terpenica]MBF6106723.1 helix-turn-helix domain-containing protein [Nocardia terpenica]MBF6114621.1 helix-turn-helix domain-containing protein [Nocardia terpenica]MBF6121293.1 helix-turn-helix domain-containing protein [Nocardia terpenica]MBF6153708.1 helix-turn-helix domain-containing protein [Nocardia terpenica]